jgi:hypothetical protein
LEFGNAYRVLRRVPELHKGWDDAHKAIYTRRPDSILNVGQDLKFFVATDSGESGQSKSSCEACKPDEGRAADLLEVIQLAQNLAPRKVQLTAFDVGSIFYDGVVGPSVDLYAFLHGNSPAQITVLIAQRRRESRSIADLEGAAHEFDKLILSRDALPDPILLEWRGKVAKERLGKLTFVRGLDYALQDRFTALRRTPEPSGPTSRLRRGLSTL